MSQEVLAERLRASGRQRSTGAVRRWEATGSVKGEDIRAVDEILEVSVYELLGLPEGHATGAPDDPHGPRMSRDAMVVLLEKLAELRPDGDERTTFLEAARILREMPADIAPFEMPIMGHVAVASERLQRQADEEDAAELAAEAEAALRQSGEHLRSLQDGRSDDEPPTGSEEPAPPAAPRRPRGAG